VDAIIKMMAMVDWWHDDDDGEDDDETYLHPFCFT
jgi:hypothetical protein